MPGGAVLGCEEDERHGGGGGGEEGEVGCAGRRGGAERGGLAALRRAVEAGPRALWRCGNG